jgi:hypothetical protein
MIGITSGLRHRIRMCRADAQRGPEFVMGTGGRTTHRLLAAIEPNSEARNADTFGALKLILACEQPGVESFSRRSKDVYGFRTWRMPLMGETGV